VVTTFNNWSQERQFQKLNKRQKDRLCYVVRNGKTQRVSIFNLVVGDIFRVESGEILPCDGLVVDANSIGVAVRLYVYGCIISHSSFLPLFV
jgi:Ca2+-transporting ATPase